MHLPHLEPAGEGRVGALYAQVHGMADEAQPPVAAQGPVKQVGFGKDLEAVADAQHQASGSGKGCHFLHDGAEAGHRAGAQVVTVGEPAGQDDAVGVFEIVVLVPEVVRVGFGKAGEDVTGVVVAVGAGKHHDAETHGLFRHVRPPPPLCLRPRRISNR